MLFLYDAYFNMKYYLNGIEKISDLLENKTIMDKLGYSESSIRKAYKQRILLKRLDKYILDEDVKQSEIFKLYESQIHENEVWKELKGFEGVYFISNHGRIKKVYKKYPEGKLLLPYPDFRVILDDEFNSIKYKKKSNKVFVHLKREDGKRVELIVARLVGDNFIESLDEEESSGKKYYGHVNGLFYDNRVENLVPMTKQELGDVHGRHSRAIEIEKIDINTGEVIDSYYSVREAGRQNFISYQAVLDNLNGKTSLACGEFLFKYSNFKEKVI